MDELKAVHFFNLAHYAAFNPFLNRHAVVLDQYGYENGINVPAGYRHCENCGIFHVPGLTSSIRVVYLKKTSKKEKKKSSTGVFKSTPRQRNLHVTCLSCRHVQIHQVLITRKLRSIDTNGALPVTSATTDGPKPSKKKKKKRSELSSLLEEKKKMQSQNLGLGSLSLFEFMQ